MPSIDDLRDVLMSREEHAGDLDAVVARLQSPRPVRRFIAPGLAAAAVIAVAATTVVLATGDDGMQQPAGGGVPSASSVPFTGSAPPATSAAPKAATALIWTISFRPVAGYAISREGFAPDGQFATVTPTVAGGARGSIFVHSDHSVPKTLGTGQRVLVDGHAGRFSPGTGPRSGSGTAAGDPDTQPRLIWQYATGKWAEVDGPFGYRPATHDYDNATALAIGRELAAALRLNAHDAVTMPFALNDVPAGLRPEATNGSAQICIGYSDGTTYPNANLGSILKVCRTKAGDEAAIAHDGLDREVTHPIGDGTSLVLVLDKDHLNLLSANQLQTIAADANVSPALGDPSTWLPVS